MLGATPALIFRAPAQVTVQASLRDLGAETDVEVGFADPHSMQDARELASHGSDRAQHARPFGRSAGPTPAMPTISGPAVEGLQPPRMAPPERLRGPAC